MNVFRKIFLPLGITIEIFLLLLVTYSFSALALSAITVNPGFSQSKNDPVEIYLRTNGVHTDLVLPFKDQRQDWGTFVKPSDTGMGDSKAVYVSFGWGDKGFYLNTKTWSDLSLTTTIKALFYLDSSAMHVTFYNSIRESPTCLKICIGQKNYAKLVEYIKAGFRLNAEEEPILIRKAGYGNNDSFYEANGTYGLFYTCNTWTNNGLMSAGLKCCAWTPFDKGILAKYKSSE
ncbi:MAG TPA: TIGR02117 family protein [Bacteroidia bacterium]|nr:TIGR02117 family protein [Bacteroidia bacterium]